MTEETVKGDPDRNVGPEEGVRPREKWANKKEFMLSMTGILFGMPTFARFPYLLFKHGGVCFLYAYCICLFFIGMPMLFLETALGQYTSEGAVTAWRKICPMFQGVGIASQMIVTYGNIYFIVTLSWTIFYLINSLRSPLPWSTCENVWNTETCHSHVSIYANPHLFRPGNNWSFLNNVTLPEDPTFTDYTYENETDTNSPENEYWLRRVLRVSDESLGNVHWDLALCLLLAWVICYFCTWKGIRITGKVVYATATLPYALLVILFFRAVTLPGASIGLRYSFILDFSRWGDISLWTDAVCEVFYSHAVSMGVLTTLGSYNKYKTDCYRDCWILSCLIAVTNVVACLVVFSMVGFLAEELSTDIAEIMSSGVGLLFITFPRVLSMLPGSSFWAFLFFTMILLVALDNQCLCMETLATAITDLFPRYLRRPLGREILVLVIAVVSFLLGLPFLTNGGIHLFTLIDFASGSNFCILVIIGLEAVIVSWVYGADRFYDNIEDMIGYKPFPVLKYCWMFIIPVVCWLTLMFELDYAGGLYGYHGDYVLSHWYRALCGVIIASVLICIPVFILIALCTDVNNMTRSSKDLRQTRPYRPVLTLCKRVISVGQQRLTRNVEEGNEKLMMEENPSV